MKVLTYVISCHKVCYIRVPTRQGKVREISFFLQGQGKVREFCKMVKEIRKSSKVREKSGNFKIMFG